MLEVRSGLDLVSKSVADRIGYKFSREFEKKVILNAGCDVDAVFTKPEVVEEFFTAMVMRTFMGNMRYEEGGDTMFRPGDETYNLKGYTFCDWNKYTWMMGLRNKTKAFCEGEYCGNRELLPDISNYAMFLYILFEHNDRITPYTHTYAELYALIAQYVKTHDKNVLVSIGATALAEYVDPLHPNSQYVEMDQSIHGKEASGSVRPVLKIWR